MPSLTKRALDAARPRDTDYFLWCENTPGFGARIHPSGRKVFVAQVRVRRAIRRVKIGLYGPFTVDQARQRAGPGPEDQHRPTLAVAQAHEPVVQVLLVRRGHPRPP